VNLQSAQFDELGFDPFDFQFIQDVAKQDGRIAAFAGTPVDREDFDMRPVHGSFSLWDFSGDTRSKSRRNLIVRLRPCALAVFCVTTISDHFVLAPLRTTT
jgi:hypothetical protein